MASEKLAVVVPMKPLQMAKQRLRPAVGDAARQHLAGAMLAHVLHTVQDSGVADVVGELAAGIAHEINNPLNGMINYAQIIANDPGVLALAATHGFLPITDSPLAGYNTAVRRASTWAQAHGAHALLILPSDLPFLTTTDLHALRDLLPTSAGIVIAPDAHETGTNALLLRPPDLIPPCFGPHSFQRHSLQALNLGLLPIIYHSPTLAHDIDIPADLTYLHG